MKLLESFFSTFQSKDYVTAGIAFASFIASLINIYLTQFRTPRIAVRIGPNVHIWYNPGGSGFYIPSVFQNTSPRSGIVQKAYLTVRAPDEKYHTVRWQYFSSIDSNTIEYKRLGSAVPFSVAGNAAELRVFEFHFPLLPDGSPSLRFFRGNYEVTLYAWTSDGIDPDLSATEIFNITPELEQELDGRLRSGSPTTSYFPFVGRSKFGEISTHRPNFKDLIF